LVRLSVNINKIATLRNARGGNVPDLILAAKRAESYGAQGITVHPRPDERHIRYRDVYQLAEVVRTEFNIEGFPDPNFLKLVEEVKPAQVTLVPDGPDVLTSNAGWDCLKHAPFLAETVSRLQEGGMRVSLFLDPDLQQVEAAAATGTDRIEFYTEAYASAYLQNREQAIQPYLLSADLAVKLGLGLNAGHDLNLDNLRFLAARMKGLEEVSIGHALIADALYFGLENSIRMYLRQLEMADIKGEE
jgi:pyridoxine 5-phosphate synthase